MLKYKACSELFDGLIRIVEFDLDNTLQVEKFPAALLNDFECLLKLNLRVRIFLTQEIHNGEIVMR